MTDQSYIVSCAGSFESNASVVRAVAVCSYYRRRSGPCKLALKSSSANKSLAHVFGVSGEVSRSFFSTLIFLLLTPRPHIVVHLVNVSLKNLVLASVAKTKGGFVIVDWDEWASKIPASLQRRWFWWVAELISFAISDVFVVASRFLQAELMQSKGIKAVLYVPYGFMPGIAVSPPLVLLDGKSYVAYVGSFASNYIGDLAEILKCGRCAKREGWTMLIIGDGELLPSLRRDLANAEIPVCFLGRMPPEDVDAVLTDRRIRAGFLPLEATRQNLARCPNKIFHYIKASLPVVTSRIGEASEALGELGCYYRFGDEVDLAAALKRTGSRVPYRLESFGWDVRLQKLGSLPFAQGDWRAVV